jgi:hypothetical protein
MAGAVAGAEHLTWSNPDSFMPQQFKNAANPEIHFKTTGPEIWVPTGGRIGVLVSGVGTGGTISGIARYIDPSRFWQALPHRTPFRRRFRRIRFTQENLNFRKNRFRSPIL